MTDSNSLKSAFRKQALSALDVAVLERDSRGDFSLLEPIPEWWAPAFNSTEHFCDRSPFLEDFITGAAADLWDRPGEDARTLRSGIWEETSDGISRFFEATASRRESGESLLIVAPAEDQWQRQQAFVQIAHDESLSRRQLRKELEKKQILLQCIMHDLGSPLATVLTNLQHVQRHLEDSEGTLKLALNQAITQAERHQDLTRSIADVFAADVAGTKSEDVSTDLLNLTTVTAETVAACAPAAAEKGITLCPFFGPPLEVVGDTLSLSRVVENLLVNAIQHSPKNGTVSISFEKTNGFAVCRIEDNGPGIDPKRQETLFQTFAKDSEQKGRAGLGLYFCRMTVEIWGGTITGKNRPEGGAAFEFRLPLANGVSAG